jgi:outer membrane protein OmpA-like peptidoglycan-associated protein
MQINDRFEWKDTQTEEDVLLGREKSRYDGTQRADELADLARQREELEAERRALAEQQDSERKRKTEERAAEDSRRERELADMARQREELEAERARNAAERSQMLLDLAAAEDRRQAAEQAAEAAEVSRREAAAGILLQKAVSRKTLSTAQHKREEAEAAEHRAEELLLEAEEKRRRAEEEERRHHEEIAAMAAVRQELQDTLQEQQVEFVMNKAELSAAGRESCRLLVPILLRNPSLAICIDSHTNCFLEKCKDHCIHMSLSQQRVDAVKDELKKGGAHNNIITKGWGCKHPEIKNQRAVHIYPAPKHHPDINKMASL